MQKQKHPKRPNKLILKLAFLFYGNKFFKKRVKLIDDGSLKNIKPPYILVANHCSAVDVFAIVKMLGSNTANFIASQTQFSYYGGILNSVGVIKKKQFVVSPSLIKDVKYILQKNGIVALFPEGKFSLDGTPNKISKALAKLVKMLNATLVTVCFSGNYLYKPRWASDSRFVPIKADVKLAVERDSAKDLTVDEIHEIVVKNLTYDDFEYQKTNKIQIESPTLLNGIEGILFKCPKCASEYSLVANGSKITCEKCDFEAKMDKFGVLTTNLDKNSALDTIPKWNDFQRDCLKSEVESQNYCISTDCEIEYQTKYKFKKLIGKAHLLHDKNGILLTLPEKIGGTKNANSNSVDCILPSNQPHKSKSNQPQLSPQYFFKNGTFPTMSFENDSVYLPTKDIIFRVKLPKIGMSAKINLAVEELAKQKD